MATDIPHASIIPLNAPRTPPRSLSTLLIFGTFTTRQISKEISQNTRSKPRNSMANAATLEIALDTGTAIYSAILVILSSFSISSTMNTEISSGVTPKRPSALTNALGRSSASLEKIMNTLNILKEKLLMKNFPLWLFSERSSERD